MRWEDERYVRVYTRDTIDWKGLSFDAQGLFCLILRKVDRAGIMVLGRKGRGAVAIGVDHPHLSDRIDSALGELLTDGCVRIVGDVLIIPNFIEAQEAPQSDAQRKRESRARARDLLAAKSVITDLSGATPPCHDSSLPGHDSGLSVTNPEKMSHPVTSGHSVPSVLSRALKETPIVPLQGTESSPPVHELNRRRSRSQQKVDLATLAKDEMDLVTYWQQQCDRKKTTPDQLDIDRLRDCLKDTELAGELGETEVRVAGLAIKGCSRDDFSMGRQPGHPARHNDLSLIFRDRKHVRKFVDIARAASAGKPTNGGGPRQESFRERDARLVQETEEQRWDLMTREEQAEFMRKAEEHDPK